MLAVKPVTLNVVPVGVPIDVPPLHTSYPVTPTASVDAAQFNVKLVWVIDADDSVAGTVGAVTSAAALVVTLSAVLCADQFPAASLALTVML